MKELFLQLKCHKLKLMETCVTASRNKIITLMTPYALELVTLKQIMKVN